VFPVRYELNFYMVFGRNSVFNGLRSRLDKYDELEMAD
jgi:hypothetical protein